MADIVNRGNRVSGGKKDLWFVLALLLWPTLQFIVFYIGVNANSLLLMFQKIKYDPYTFTTVKEWNAFGENWNWLTNIFLKDKDINFAGMIKNSLICWLSGILIGSPLGLLFSYYVSKKMPGSGAFRIILYLPSIISSFILVLMYKYLVNYNIGPILGQDVAIMKNGTLFQRFFLLIFFNIWCGFGTSVLMYTNSMSAISPDIIESASLDGATGFKEFIHIIFPHVWSTWSVFFVTSVAMLFTNQYNLYSLYGDSCPEDMKTIGYYLFYAVRNSGNGNMYGKLALLGLFLSAIAIPVTLIIRKVMDKVGPSTK